MNTLKIKTFAAVLVAVLLISALQAQEPFRRGTTAANFLEIGYGSRGACRIHCRTHWRIRRL